METNEKTMGTKSAEEMAEFMAWKEEKLRKAKLEAKKMQRQDLQKLVDEEMGRAVGLLMACSDQMKAAKGTIFENFATLMDMRREINEEDNPEGDEQFSFTFTSSDGTQRLRIGHNVNEGYLDQVEDGIKKVREYLKTLAKDEKSSRLVDAVMRLLARDQKGNLKASRVLQLSKMAEESGNDTFKEGMSIIRDAYRPTRGKTYIRCQVKTAKLDSDGNPVMEGGKPVKEWSDVGLSMAEV
ncbi:MAG: DUF3164 family protein [Bacteroidales bacterium]|nr:DUF3164 family protein [Bacteroidales bacterium]